MIAPKLVYGPDAFTVGANIELHAYNAAWINDAWGGATTISVRTLTNDARLPAADGTAYRWTGVTLVDMRITGTIGSGLNAAPAYSARMDASGNGYVVEWATYDNLIHCWRAHAAPTAWDDLGTFGTVANATTYTNAFLKVSGKSLVTLVFGDDTNGTFRVTDSTAGRYLTGAPGLVNFEGTAPLTSSWDLLSIYNEAPWPNPANVGQAVKRASVY